MFVSADKPHPNTIKVLTLPLTHLLLRSDSMEEKSQALTSANYQKHEKAPTLQMSCLILMIVF